MGPVLRCFLLTALLAGAGWAPSVSHPAVAEEATLATPETDLTPDEIAERDSRKACKVAICAAMLGHAPGDDIRCSVTKSFRKARLDKILAKAKASWPWGRVVCTSDLTVSRDMLSKAISEPKAEATFSSHRVTCKVERDNEAAADISVEFAPTVSFENGKAQKAALNWGKVEGPTVIKGLLWTATATDNTVNVLGTMVVDSVNDYVTNTCSELKADWAGQ